MFGYRISQNSGIKINLLTKSCVSANCRQRNLNNRVFDICHFTLVSTELNKFWGTELVRVILDGEYIFIQWLRVTVATWLAGSELKATPLVTLSSSVRLFQRLLCSQSLLSPHRGAIPATSQTRFFPPSSKHAKFVSS
ncbi:hypothetical protein YC2023_073329 [Brassica napus]